MSATNHTTNYELPIFVGTDKPAWLVDWNGAMTAIDTAIHTAEGKADQAGTDIGGIESSISTINSTLTSINNAVSQLRIDTNANTGSINTITSLIGNGEPTTTDKTLIGAINELDALLKFNDSAEATVTSSVGTVLSGDDRYKVRAFKNSQGSFGKIYGAIYIENATIAQGTNKVIAHIQSDNIPTVSEAFNIYGIEAYRPTWDSAGSTIDTVDMAMMRVNTDHSADIILPLIGRQVTATFINVVLPPCLYSFTNLSD